MGFVKYQHLERFGTSEVSGIEIGECYVFPKLDGANASIWLEDGEICCGSRNRKLSLEYDNAFFCKWVHDNKDRFMDFFTTHPTVTLYGEWLCKHSIDTYYDDAWNQFYVFDVCVNNDNETIYISYDVYKLLLDFFNINYIPPICVIKNGSYEQFIEQLQKNVFLIQDGKGVGEGIVIKNYSFLNKYYRKTWAKIVTSEFKEKHGKTMGSPTIEGKKLVEENIAINFVTQALVDKEYCKIEVESGWSSNMIPRLLNTIYYSVIKEDSWEFIKKYHDPTINFKTLKMFVFNEVKKKRPELF